MYIRCKKEKVTNPETVVKIIRNIMSKWSKIEKEKEHFFTIGLRTDGTIKYVDLTFTGTSTHCIAVPYEPIRTAIFKGATGMIIVHNHLCTPEPSGPDNSLTKTFKEACKIVGIRFLDHVIVAPIGYYSYSNNNTL